MSDRELTEIVDSMGRSNPSFKEKIMTRGRAYREGRTVPVSLAAAVEPYSNMVFYFQVGPESSFPENSWSPVLSEHRKLKEDFYDTLTRGFKEELGYDLHLRNVYNSELKAEIKYPTKTGARKVAFTKFFVVPLNPYWVKPNQDEIKTFDLKDLEELETLIEQKRTPVSHIEPQSFIQDCIKETRNAMRHFSQKNPHY